MIEKTARIIISSKQPESCQQWDFRRDTINESLLLYNGWWFDIAKWVSSVNGKVWDVNLNLDDICPEEKHDYDIMTWAGWKSPDSSVSEFSNGLITSGAVYEHTEPMVITISWIQSSILDLNDNKVDRNNVESVFSWSKNKIPTSYAIKDYVESNTLKGSWPVSVQQSVSWWREIVIRQANKMQSTDGLWVCRFASSEDYFNSDSNSAITPDVIKPVIDNLQRQIDELKTLISN